MEKSFIPMNPSRRKSTDLRYKFLSESIEREKDSGNQMITFNGKSYMFVYSKLSAGDLMVTALIPSDRLLEQSSESNS